MVLAFTAEEVQYSIVKTFVTVCQEKEPSRRRSGSAPPKCVFVAKARPSQYPAKTKPFQRQSSMCSTGVGSSTSSAASWDRPSLVGATLRIGNVPNRAKPDRIKALCDDLGLGECVDSIYIPMDTKTGVGKGYAFIHFVDADVAQQFYQAADGRQLPRSTSPKLMNITFASHQTVASLPTQMPKTGRNDRSYTAFLWIR